jgi:hypothetical protein
MSSKDSLDHDAECSVSHAALKKGPYRTCLCILDRAVGILDNLYQQVWNGFALCGSRIAPRTSSSRSKSAPSTTGIVAANGQRHFSVDYILKKSDGVELRFNLTVVESCNGNGSFWPGAWGKNFIKA